MTQSRSFSVPLIPVITPGHAAPWLWLLVPCALFATPPESPPPSEAALPTSPEPAATPISADNCAACHYCDRPTRQDPCLRPICTRYQVMPSEPQHGPDLVILDQLEKDYLPVPFDHKSHAHMAEMGRGCATCHHFTPPGQRPPACKACHDPHVAGTDPRKPGLKGAYHQQCLNCHREWIDETACEICHRPKTDHPGRASSGFPTTDEILGRMHPPITPPHGDFYSGQSDQTAGSRVLFRHEEHTRRFGLACTDCHHEPSCARCHSKPGQAPQRTLAEHHSPCVTCHKEDMSLAGRSAGRCERCHCQEDCPMPDLFDHASVGWPLGQFHEQLHCRACHTAVPFTALDSNCEACHTGWSPGTFDHNATGQSLDAHHAGLDCELCHRDRRFDRPPTCDECHDADDGPAFPNQRPGPVTAPRQTRGAINAGVE